jgi:hypothetical protein
MTLETLVLAQDKDTSHDSYSTGTSPETSVGTRIIGREALRGRRGRKRENLRVCVYTLNMKLKRTRINDALV